MRGLISESIAASLHRSAQHYARGFTASQCSTAQGNRNIAVLSIMSGGSQHRSAQQLRRIATQWCPAAREDRSIAVPNSTLHLLMQRTERNTTAYHMMLQHTTRCYSMMLCHEVSCYNTTRRYSILHDAMPCYSIRHDAAAYYTMLQHTA